MSGNDRLISGPMMTHMRNGSTKAAEWSLSIYWYERRRPAESPIGTAKPEATGQRSGYLEVEDKPLAL